jgi:hypothetical protein
LVTTGTGGRAFPPVYYFCFFLQISNYIFFTFPTRGPRGPVGEPSHQCINFVFFFRFLITFFYLPNSGTTGTGGRAFQPVYQFCFFLQISKFIFFLPSHLGDHGDHWKSLPPSGTTGTGGRAFPPVYYFVFFFRFLITFFFTFPPRVPQGLVGEPSDLRDLGDQWESLPTSILILFFSSDF